MVQPMRSCSFPRFFLLTSWRSERVCVVVYMTVVCRGVNIGEQKHWTSILRRVVGAGTVAAREKNKHNQQRTGEEKRIEHSVREPHGPHETLFRASFAHITSRNFIAIVPVFFLINTHQITKRAPQRPANYFRP